MDEIFSFDLAAASWRRDIKDEKAFVEALATRLQQALPDKTQVDRHRGWFAKQSEVVRISVAFDTTEYILTFSGNHGVHTARAKVVRGIRLKTEDVAFSQWLSDLSSELAAFASQHADARESMERFLFS